MENVCYRDARGKKNWPVGMKSAEVGDLKSVSASQSAEPWKIHKKELVSKSYDYIQTYERICQWQIMDIGGWALINESSNI